MNKFLRKVKSGLPIVLSVVSVIGLFGTTIEAIRATPKALTLINEAEEKKGEKLSKGEIVKAAWKPYILTVVFGVSTASCIIGAAVLNKQQQASLASAYTLASTAYAKYKNKVKELYGEEAHKKIISSIAAEKSHAEPICSEIFCSNACLDFGDKEEEILFYDVFSQRYFTSTLGKVLQAEYHLNRNYTLRGDATVNEFYDFLGISHIDGGDIIGWSAFDGLAWIDFDHYREITDDGLDIHFINTPFEPSDCLYLE